MAEKRDLFSFMVNCIGDVATKSGLQSPQGFIQWFVELYYLKPHDLFISDGSHDGKVDAFFTTHNGSSVTHHIINSKFTKTYDKIAPPSFYNEIAFFGRAFLNKGARESFLEKAVKLELRPKYRQLFDYFDQERAQLLFVTNHRRNDKYYTQVADGPVEVFHLEDLLQYLIDDIDGAMPRTAFLSPYRAFKPFSPLIAMIRKPQHLSSLLDSPTSYATCAPIHTTCCLSETLG